MRGQNNSQFGNLPQMEPQTNNNPLFSPKAYNVVGEIEPPSEKSPANSNQKGQKNKEEKKGDPKV